MLERRRFYDFRWLVGTFLFLAASVIPIQGTWALVLNEIMFHPEEEEDTPREWIELYNERLDPLDLSGYTICNGVSFEIPAGTWIDGHEYLIICADVDAFSQKYNANGLTVLGGWEGALSNGGERVEICNPGGVAVIDVRYNDRGKWPVAADGTGHSIALIDPFTDLSDADNWTHSRQLGGTPGRANGLGGIEPGEPSGDVVLNEALIRTAGERWIELYNRSGAPISLGGYFITDDPAELARAALPAGTTIPPRGRLSFTDEELGLDFTLDGARVRVFIALVDPDGDRVIDAYNFEPAFDELSEARLPDGDREFDDAADPSRNEVNRLTVNQDIVINEIMYHTIDDDLDGEFVELYNRGEAAVNMTGWSFTRGIDFDIPPGTSIAPGEYLVIARNPAHIIDTYGLAGNRVLGPDQESEALDDFGVLRDSGERITLKDEFGRTVDTLSFEDGNEWPRWADGHGSSIELIDSRQDNRFGLSWDASDDSEKAPTQTYLYIDRHGGGESEFHVLLLNRGITVVDDLSIVGDGILFEDNPFIDEGEVWAYFRGTEAPPANWKEFDFDDSAWERGATGIGYGDGDDVTEITDMRNNYLTIFCRKNFTVTDPSSIDELVLSIVIDDGFIAYLNGQEVASFNASGPEFDDSAGSAGEPQLIDRDISEFKDLLRVGDNVLAISLHNANLGSSDLSFIPRFVDRTTTITEGAELLDNGSFESNTSGWVIEGNHIRSGRTTTEALNGTGSLKLVASGRGDNKVNRLETPEQDGHGLADLDEDTELAISFKARWCIGSQTLLTHGYAHAMARAHDLAVPKNLGTPGRINSATQRQLNRTGGNLGPVMAAVHQEPAVPNAGQAVTVRCRVSDADGIEPGSVQLHYALNDPNPTPTAVVMNDIGAGIYEARVPGQALKTRVVYFITATDGNGLRGRYPVDVTERTHPLLLDPAAASLNDHRYLLYRHDTAPNTQYHSYRFWMTASEEARLNSRRRHSNDLVHGSFIFGNDTIYQESFARFAGSPFARGTWGGSWRVAMPRGNLLHGTIRKFNLENHGTNAKERISHYLIRNNQGAIRVPYSDDQVMVRWQVNDRTTNTREHVWVPDVQFISLWYPEADRGDLFEIDDRHLFNDNGGRAGSTNARLLYPPPSSRDDGDGMNKENYRWFFGLRSRNGVDDYTNLIDFARIMDPGVTSNEDFDEQINGICDVEEMLRIWAVRLNTSDWDTWGASRGKNAYLYRLDGIGRWVLLAWDMELTYSDTGRYLIPQNPSSNYNPGGFAEVNRLFNRPWIKRTYYAILDEMVNGPGAWFDADFLTTAMDKLSSIGMSSTNIGRNGGYIDERADLIRDRISSVVYPQQRLRITTSGGNDFSTPDRKASLAGTTPVEVAQILITNNTGDSVVYPMEFSDMTSWQIDDILLIPGPNELLLLGYDLRGNLVDSDTITITSTAPEWPTPTLTSISPPEAPPETLVEIQGEEFHDGLRVFFGLHESPRVIFDESGPNADLALVEVPQRQLGSVEVSVKNLDGKTSNSKIFVIVNPPLQFVRGDANLDGRVDLSDAVKILLHLFHGSPLNCLDAADTDDSENLELTDAILVLDLLYRGGSRPPAPYPDPGLDPAGDQLGCD